MHETRGKSLRLLGTQAGIGVCHLPWRHLEMRVLVLKWYPGSQKKWMELLWGNPRHGDGSQRKPPCSGTRGWEQLPSRPAENNKTQRWEKATIKIIRPVKSDSHYFCWWRSIFAASRLCSTSSHAFVVFKHSGGDIHTPSFHMLPPPAALRASAQFALLEQRFPLYIQVIVSPYVTP